MSSMIKRWCAAEHFHSDASLESVDRRAPNNSKNWQWTTEGDVSVRRLTSAPHDGEGTYSFLLAVGSMSVYCYRCTNAGFVNSSTSAAPWIACKDESCFDLRDNEGRIRVRRYAGERCLPECVIERHCGPELRFAHSELWFGVRFCIMDNSICNELRYVWDLVGGRLARDSHPAASKDELLLRIQEIRNYLPQADIQNLFDSMPRRIATLIASRDGYIKY
ncbi:uncharacterized protein TNCV_4082891 [Trichonephila clavipes]|nr:uncharacterized protein TNCV_4082891 [Trichonephila clavipes]